MEQPRGAERHILTEVAVTVARKRAATWLLGIIGTPLLLLLGVLVSVVLVVAVAAGNSTATGSVSNGAPSAVAYQLIPPDMLALYRSDLVKQECPTLSWAVVAAIIHLESRDNRNPSTSYAGAMGPSQFMPSTWNAQGQLVVDVGSPYGRVPQSHGYALDGSGDGFADIMNPYDSVPATARMLCANGGGNPSKLADAIFAYNHANWYVHGGLNDQGAPFEGVLPLAQRLVQDQPLIDLQPGMTSGKVIIAEGANLPGQPITPETMAFLSEVAGIYGKPLTVTTGTNHSYLTVDGKVSDHASGHGADIGMIANGGTDDSPVGDAIAAACLAASGYTPDAARQLAYAGGAWTTVYGGLRIQCIWKTYIGGNHHNHVHIGVRPA